MRIIIETDGSGTAPQVSVQGQQGGDVRAPVIMDGGQPATELLAALAGEAGAELLAPHPTVAGAGSPGGGPEDAGSPPQWLLDVIEGSAGTRPPQAGSRPP